MQQQQQEQKQQQQLPIQGLEMKTYQPMVDCKDIGYNVDLEVKYFQLERDLLEKIAAREKVKTVLQEVGLMDQDIVKESTTATIDNTDTNIDYEYTEEDVKEICQTIYQTELCKAFHVETYLDESINLVMQKVFEELFSQNNKFIGLLYKVRKTYSGDDFNDLEDSDDDSEEINSFNNFLFCMLFSYDLFHVMHKAICEQLTQGSISDDILDELYNEICLVFEKTKQLQPFEDEGGEDEGV